jgi:hypothetical protein
VPTLEVIDFWWVRYTGGSHLSPLDIPQGQLNGVLKYKKGAPGKL